MTTTNDSINLITVESITIADVNTIKGFAAILMIFGVVFMIFSIFAFTAYGTEGGISLTKFLLLFLFSFPLFIGGIIIYRRAKIIAHETYSNKIYEKLFWILPICFSIIMILFVETIINCKICISTTLISIIGFILIGLFSISIYLIYKYRKGIDLKTFDLLQDTNSSSQDENKDIRYEDKKNERKTEANSIIIDNNKKNKNKSNNNIPMDQINKRKENKATEEEESEEDSDEDDFQRKMNEAINSQTEF